MSIEDMLADLKKKIHLSALKQYDELGQKKALFSWIQDRQLEQVIHQSQNNQLQLMYLQGRQLGLLVQPRIQEAKVNRMCR